MLCAPLLLSGSTVSWQRQPVCTVFCSRCIVAPFIRSKINHCSALHTLRATMASADFLQISGALLPRLSLWVACAAILSATTARSPRVRAITFPSYIRRIYIAGLGQYWTSLWIASLSSLTMPHTVLVHRTEGLPPASFRFHLTVDTLAIG